jgi:NhaP-type Na+/H+ and K+/H+ antiporter
MTGPRSAELQALTALYRALFRDAPGPLTDTAWLAHGFLIGALLGTTDAGAARRYVDAVLADAQALTGTAAAALEAEYRRAAAELVRRGRGAAD